MQVRRVPNLQGLPTDTIVHPLNSQTVCCPQREKKKKKKPLQCAIKTAKNPNYPAKSKKE